MRIILNGKKAGYTHVRDAISAMRQEGVNVEVRVTYEYGDIARFVKEAVAEDVSRLVIGGGDGSIHEIVDALAKIEKGEQMELAVLPLGTANDFATACEIPMDTFEALRLAARGEAIATDIVKANDTYFINMATMGFGAQVTANTPEDLKNFLGGGAYTISGVLQALSFEPYKTTMRSPEFSGEITGVAAAIGNARQAGGGQLLAPYALINDGLLDVVIISYVPILDMFVFLDELRNPTPDGKYVKYFQTPWVEWESEQIIPTNLDGEPYHNQKIHLEVIPKALKLVLPKHCPCLKDLI